MRKTVGIFALSVALALSSNVNATGFDGAAVTVTGYCCSAPVESDRVTVPLTNIVGPGVEFPIGSIQSATGIRLVETNIDIGNSTISYTSTANDTLAGGSFNGAVFDFAGSNLPNIVGVSLDPLSTFAPAAIGLSFDPDTVRINNPGLHVAPGSLVLVNVEFTSAVPEPETYAMFLAGLGLLGLMSRSSKNSPNLNGS